MFRRLRSEHRVVEYSKALRMNESVSSPCHHYIRDKVNAKVLLIFGMKTVRSLEMRFLEMRRSVEIKNLQNLQIMLQHGISEYVSKNNDVSTDH